MLETRRQLVFFIFETASGVAAAVAVVVVAAVAVAASVAVVVVLNIELMLSNIKTDHAMSLRFSFCLNGLWLLHSSAAHAS